MYYYRYVMIEELHKIAGRNLWEVGCDAFYLSTKTDELYKELIYKRIDQEDVVFLAICVAHGQKDPAVYRMDEDRFKESLHHIVVWDDSKKAQVEEIYRTAGVLIPKIVIGIGEEKDYYYTKGFFAGREFENYVTGPKALYEKYKSAVASILKRRSEGSVTNPSFENVEDAIGKIKEDFEVLPELAGICGLRTNNRVHWQPVDEHTRNAVSKLPDNKYYHMLTEEEKQTVELALYLHDIGKGPKTKWWDGVQRIYYDHPADAIPMLERILSEEIREISEERINQICVLIAYHDLLGDSMAKGRHIEELDTLKLTQQEKYMLAALSIADITSINEEWIPGFLEWLRGVV